MSASPSPSPLNSEPKPWIVVEDRPPTANSAGSAKRKSAHDTTVIWVMFGLIGVALAAYAVRVAYAPPVAVEAAAPAVAQPTETAPEAPPQRPVSRPRVAAVPPASHPKSEPAKADEPKVEYVTETPQPKDLPAADPEKAFETGKLFDQPNVANRSGRPGSFENPVHGRPSSFDNPPRGYVNRRAPNPSSSERPNTPDPSFRKND